MRKVLLALSVFALTASCTHKRPDDAPELRAPSSEHSEKPDILETLLSSDNPREASRLYVEKLILARLRATAWIREQDEAYNQANGAKVDIFEMPTYRKLLVTRAYVDRIEHEISGVYSDALILSRRDNRGPTADKAFFVVAGIRDALVTAWRSPAQRVLLHDLVATMKETIGESAEAHGLPLQNASTGSATKLPVKTLSAFELAKTAIAETPTLIRMANALPNSDEVTEEIHEELSKTTFTKEERSGREPQSGMFFPSTGTPGHTRGVNFPDGTFALTFDDGPNPLHTMKIVAELQKAGVKGTFFWIAKNVKVYPQIVKDVMAAGMAVENHSWNHAKLTDPVDLANLKSSLQHEISDSTDLMTKAYGRAPKYFRCPYGAGGNPDEVKTEAEKARVREVRAVIAKKGMVHIKWNVDSEDWGDKNPQSVLARTLAQMNAEKSGIVLFHDRKPVTPGVVKSLLAKVKSKYRWVTIPQIMDEMNGVR